MTLRTWLAEITKEYPPIDPATKARLDAEFGIGEKRTTLDDIGKLLRDVKSTLSWVALWLFVIAVMLFIIVGR